MCIHGSLPADCSVHAYGLSWWPLFHLSIALRLRRPWKMHHCDGYVSTESAWNDWAYSLAKLYSQLIVFQPLIAWHRLLCYLFFFHHALGSFVLLCCGLSGKVGTMRGIALSAFYEILNLTKYCHIRCIWFFVKMKIWGKKNRKKKKKENAKWWWFTNLFFHPAHGFCGMIEYPQFVFFSFPCFSCSNVVPGETKRIAKSSLDNEKESGHS